MRETVSFLSLIEPSVDILYTEFRHDVLCSRKFAFAVQIPNQISTSTAESLLIHVSFRVAFRNDLPMHFLGTTEVAFVLTFNADGLSILTAYIYKT